MALVPKFVSTFESPKCGHLWPQGPGTRGVNTPRVTAVCGKVWKPLPTPSLLTSGLRPGSDSVTWKAVKNGPPGPHPGGPGQDLISRRSPGDLRAHCGADAAASAERAAPPTAAPRGFSLCPGKAPATAQTRSHCIPRKLKPGSKRR